MLHPIFAMFDLPAAPTAGGIGVVLVIVLYRLIIDRSAVKSEITNLQSQVEGLSAKVDHLEQQNNEQRGLKHRAVNDLRATSIVLQLVRRLAETCTCGALDPLSPILTSILEDLATSRERRLADMEEGPA